MKTDKILTTGFNPNINSYIGTSNESLYFETTALNNSLFSIIKNDTIIIDEPVVMESNFIVDNGLTLSL